MNLELLYFLAKVLMKAVFPVNGMGICFLLSTKAMPKVITTLPIFPSKR